nr:hypothetical protein BaRGS_027172 [Batillaria attramentaria]
MLWPLYYDPLYYPRYYRYDPLLDLEVATNIAKSRSPESLVHVDRGHYWTERAASLSGKSHRELFNSNLSKAYNRLQRNARLQDTKF